MIKPLQTNSSILSTDELIDIVDEHDQVIKTMWRSEAMAQNAHYRRVAIVFLRHQDGRLCFFKRSEHKKIEPGLLTLAGGYVQSGESYDAAFAREVLEETGLVTENLPHRFLGKVWPHETWPGYNIKGMYEITVSTLTVEFNQEDFSGYFWAHPEEFIHEIALKEKTIPGLDYLVNRFYLE